MKGWLLILLIERAFEPTIIETVGPFETRAACERAVEQLADVAPKSIHISAACVSQSESESE
jgi:hypothetical protein